MYCYLYNSSFWSSNLIGWQECWYKSPAELQQPFLTASVMPDAQIHYNFKKNIVLCHRSFLGQIVFVWTSNMQFVNKDNIYLKICFDVFGDVSSRASAAVQRS